MNFINDIDLVTSFTGRKGDLLTQVAYIVHAIMTRRINLDQVQKATFIHSLAILTFIARTLRRVRMQAVDTLCQDSRHGRFASAAWPVEQVSVAYTILNDRIAQGLRDMLLTDDVLKGARTPLEV